MVLVGNSFTTLSLSHGLEKAVLLLNPSIFSTHSLASSSAQGISCLMFCPLDVALKWNLGLLAVWVRRGREGGRDREGMVSGGVCAMPCCLVVCPSS